MIGAPTMSEPINLDEVKAYLTRVIPASMAAQTSRALSDRPSTKTARSRPITSSSKTD